MPGEINRVLLLCLFVCLFVVVVYSTMWLKQWEANVGYIYLFSH